MEKRGFTLIELSIVLVVIALLVGGLLSAQVIIRQGEVSNYTKDFAALQTFHYNFRNKYGQIAGDFPQASQYWPGATNGNNNGAVETTPEYFAYWQHAGLSGMWPGSFTGGLVPNGSNGCTNGAGCMLPGVNIGAARATNKAGYWVWKWGAMWFGKMATGVWLGGESNYQQVQGPVLSGVEARAIDFKMDDGNGSNGKLMGLVSNAAGTNCLGPVLTAAIAATAAPGSYDYYVADDTLRCRLILWLD